jgi:hypothetical protein
MKLGGCVSRVSDNAAQARFTSKGWQEKNEAKTMENLLPPKLLFIIHFSPATG